MRSVGEKVFRFESYTLDLSRGCLCQADREIELRPKSFDVLSYLVENAGRLVSKDELLKAVWRKVTVSDESVTRCISDVRLALGDSDQRIIKTVQRRGYRFAAAVSRMAARGPVSPPTLGAAAAAPAAQAVTETNAAPRLSLIVLPFLNLSVDTAQEYLADAITEGLTAYLTRIPDSFVIARTMAARYKGGPRDVRQIGKEADIQRAEKFVSRALAIDPKSYHAHHAKAQVLVAQKRAEEAMVEAEHSLRLNPSFIPAYRDLCHASLLLAQPERVIEYAEQAMRLSPPDPYLYVFYAHKGYGFFMLRSDQDAIACLRRAVANNPGHPLLSAWLAATLALTGGQAEARETLDRYLSLRGAKIRTITQFRSLMNSDNPAYLAFRERFHTGLRRAGMAEH